MSDRPRRSSLFASFAMAAVLCLLALAPALHAEALAEHVVLISVDAFRPEF